MHTFFGVIEQNTNTYMLYTRHWVYIQKEEKNSCVTHFYIWQYRKGDTLMLFLANKCKLSFDRIAYKNKL